jgi:hypothetical protein
MMKQTGWLLTGFRTWKGEEAECPIGTYDNYTTAAEAADVWLRKNGRAALRVEFERTYEELAEDEGWDE